jgi:hypothetical protein
MITDALAIPDFLKRKKKRGRPRKIVASTTDNKITLNRNEEWGKIKQQKYGFYYAMMFRDEAPRIGCGLRWVYVKEGRKWVHLTSHYGDPYDVSRRTRVRMRMSKWNELKESNEQYFKRNNPDEVAKRLSRKRYRRI